MRAGTTLPPPGGQPTASLCSRLRAFFRLPPPRERVPPPSRWVPANYTGLEMLGAAIADYLGEDELLPEQLNPPARCLPGGVPLRLGRPHSLPLTRLRDGNAALDGKWKGHTASVCLDRKWLTGTIVAVTSSEVEPDDSVSRALGCMHLHFTTCPPSLARRHTRESQPLPGGGCHYKVQWFGTDTAKRRSRFDPEVLLPGDLSGAPPATPTGTPLLEIRGRELTTAHLGLSGYELGVCSNEPWRDDWFPDRVRPVAVVPSADGKGVGIQLLGSGTLMQPPPRRRYRLLLPPPDTRPEARAGTRLFDELRVAGHRAWRWHAESPSERGGGKQDDKQAGKQWGEESRTQDGKDAVIVVFAKGEVVPALEALGGEGAEARYLAVSEEDLRPRPPPGLSALERKDFQERMQLAPALRHLLTSGYLYRIPVPAPHGPPELPASRDQAPTEPEEAPTTPGQAPA